ncbi:unnamed protein product [Caenorhabditis auriculariae]|uniref:Myotubularin phosphatase domain-containing protein n=1 Tax=Caenorhabditis auriculariae TaxID=2777116 RepID=A0A8S1GMR0_9PELO|nr:unnamed protein product [Caenorhabditis auriculariae]
MHSAESGLETVGTACEIPFLAGERVICTDNDISYFGSSVRVPGRLVVTLFRLRFISNDAQTVFDVPLGAIAKVEKFGYATATRKDSNYGLNIICKDHRAFKFAAQQTNHRRRPLVEALFRYSFPLSSDLKLFAFLHAEELRKERTQKSVDGWKIYDAKREFERMGVSESKGWTAVDINKDYKFADTYPRYLVVPNTSADSGFLERVGEFRSRQRIPVLSWLQKSSLASITRSSQPMSGLTKRRSAQDEEHLTNILYANAHSHKLNIYDARPIVNAQVNRAKGGGYEENYEGCQLQFMNIHNIHVVRESLKKLLSALIPRVDEKNFYKLLDESKWLQHVHSILSASMEIVGQVDRKMSVLVHCTDGWDRTAQLTSLSMLQLDGYYRTLEGFIVLIEKEWCSFGHKFGQRIGHGDDKHSDGERAPIFVQFIDCVWQILHQYEYYFEFTSALLICILDELFSCRFGTFLYNSEKQRHLEHNCPQTTVSLWTFVLESRNLFLNPCYRKGSIESVLFVNPSIRCLRVWTEYYARSNPDVITPQSDVAKRTGLERAVGKASLMEALTNLQSQTEDVSC